MKTFKRISTLLLIFITFFSLLLLASCKSNKAEGEMDVTFVVKSLDGSVNEEKVVHVQAGDTAWELFKENFTVDYEDSQYGPSIKGIEGVTTDWATSYFALYIDDAYATTGIDGVVMKDGMKISFIEETPSW